MPANADMSAPSEREEIEMLIPWYVTGRASVAERRRVDAFLVANPEMRRQLLVASDESAEVIGGNERIAGPSRAAVDRLMASVAASPRQVSATGQARIATAGIVERLASWISGFGPMQLAGITTAAAVLIVGQAGLIAYMAGDRQATYTTASGPQSGVPLGDGTFALVTFKATAQAKEISDLLAATGAQIVEGPRAGGLFRVRLGTAKLDPQAAEAISARLRAASGVVQLVVLQRQP